MDFWAAAVLIVAIVVVGRVMSGGRWNRQTRRWERWSAENPYVQQGLLEPEGQELRAELARLSARVATLEKLAVDPQRQLSDEIDRLRHKRSEG